MRKKVGYIVLAIALIGTCALLKNVKGWPFPTVHYFNTDKSVYIPTENMTISASWDLDYDNTTEISYVQVRLFHENGTNFWNSPQYPEIGSFQKNWTVNITTLNVIIDNNSIEIKVQFDLYYWYPPGPPVPSFTTLSKKGVNIKTQSQTDNNSSINYENDTEFDIIPILPYILIPLLIGCLALIGLNIPKKEKLI